MDFSLNKIDYENYELFTNTVMKVFDLNPLIMKDICNHDLLWRPDSMHNINYYQWITQETSERDPVLSVLSFLIDNRDPYWHEPYGERNNKEIREHLVKIMEKYKTVSNYFKEISIKLWKDNDYMSKYYSNYETKFEKLIKKLDLQKSN